jgi:hypothetical protein
VLAEVFRDQIARAAEKDDRLLTAEEAAPLVHRTVAALKKSHRGSVPSTKVWRVHMFRASQLGIGGGK